MDEITLENIPRLTGDELQKRLERKEPFEARSPLATCLIRVKAWQPLMGNVSHAGHRVREELLMKMSISEQERTQEEDVRVDLFAESLPVQIVALDSRYEYDVNRPRERAVYLKPLESWGKRVWEHPPTLDELHFSLAKYDDYHDTLEMVVQALQAAFGSVLVFDLHSYNHQRPAQKNRQAELPSFDLVLSAEDRAVHAGTIACLKEELQKVNTPQGPATVKENAVFIKDGAIAARLQPWFPQVLTLPIEIKKFYVNEFTGALNAAAVASLQQDFRILFPKVLAHFQKHRG